MKMRITRGMVYQLLLLIIIEVVFVTDVVSSFGLGLHPSPLNYNHNYNERGRGTGRTIASLRAKEKDDDTSKVKNPLVKASWFAVEAFGKIFGSNEQASENSNKVISADTAEISVDLSRPPLSLDEALKRIELDNERNYFLSGEVDVEAYAEDCTFADPFVSFDGRQRFVDNLANLGSFITKYDANFLGYNVNESGTQVDTKVSFQALLLRSVIVDLREMIYFDFTFYFSSFVLPLGHG